MVMECHKAYAVLMDEASRMVHAANLHYEVGQIVESPVLLEEQKKPVISVTLRHCIAAAACVAIAAGAGVVYYHGNVKPYSSIVVCAEANMRMDVSRSGKVLSVEPLNQDAAMLLSDYECIGKDQLTVTNELIGRAVENGYVRKGDTVGVYYEQGKSRDSEQFEKEIEKSLASHELQADIRHEVEPPAPPMKPDESAPTTQPAELPEAPAAPQHEEIVTPQEPPAIPVPEAEPAPEEKPVTPAAPEEHHREPGADVPPIPPEPAEDPAPEKPQPPEPHEVQPPAAPDEGHVPHRAPALHHPLPEELPEESLPE